MYQITVLIALGTMLVAGLAAIPVIKEALAAHSRHDPSCTITKLGSQLKHDEHEITGSTKNIRQSEERIIDHRLNIRFPTGV